jgi:hypothetical protein
MRRPVVAVFKAEATIYGVFSGDRRHGWLAIQEVESLARAIKFFSPGRQ